MIAWTQIYQLFGSNLYPEGENHLSWGVYIENFTTYCKYPLTILMSGHSKSGGGGKTIVSWRKASKDCRTIVLGDLNIDYLQWSDQNYRSKKLVQMMKDEIETMGFCQLIGKITRSWPGVPSSIVDHIWTDSPDSVMSHSNVLRTSSDHNVISTVVRTKNRRMHLHDVTRRDRKLFDINRYRDKIKAIDWSDLFASQDINIINDIFVTKVGAILEEEAPLKTFQNRIFF